MNNQVNKCPACGALRITFTAFCPDCGHEFARADVADSVQRLADKLIEIDMKCSYRDFSGSVSFFKVLGWIFLFPFMLIAYFIRRFQLKGAMLQGADRVKAELIQNFPVPNTRNDLLEFAILCDSKVEPISFLNAMSNSAIYAQKWNKIWCKKMDQIRSKAMLVLRDDSSTLNHIDGIAQRINGVYNNNETMQWVMMGFLCLIFILFCLMADLL